MEWVVVIAVVALVLALVLVARESAAHGHKQ